MDADELEAVGDGLAADPDDARREREHDRADRARAAARSRARRQRADRDRREHDPEQRVERAAERPSRRRLRCRRPARAGARASTRAACEDEQRERERRARERGEVVVAEQRRDAAAGRRVLEAAQHAEELEQADDRRDGAPGDERRRRPGSRRSRVRTISDHRGREQHVLEPLRRRHGVRARGVRAVAQRAPGSPERRPARRAPTTRASRRARRSAPASRRRRPGDHARRASRGPRGTTSTAPTRPRAGSAGAGRRAGGRAARTSGAALECARGVARGATEVGTILAASDALPASSGGGSRPPSGSTDRRCSGSLATIVAARELTKDDFARFALVFAVTGLLQLFLDLTVEEVVVKYGNRYAARGGLGAVPAALRGRAVASSSPAASPAALATVVTAFLAHCDLADRRPARAAAGRRADPAHPGARGHGERDTARAQPLRRAWRAPRLVDGAAARRDRDRRVDRAAADVRRDRDRAGRVDGLRLGGRR